MPYCMSCGKLRETVGGLCDQCRADRAKPKLAERRERRARERADARKQP